MANTPEGKFQIAKLQIADLKQVQSELEKLSDLELKTIKGGFTRKWKKFTRFAKRSYDHHPLQIERNLSL